MEAVHIKSELDEYLRELHEASALAKEQLKQLQVTFYCKCEVAFVAVACKSSQLFMVFLLPLPLPPFYSHYTEQLALAGTPS